MCLPKHHFTRYLLCMKINLKSSSVSRIKSLEYHQLGNSSNCIRLYTFVHSLIEKNCNDITECWTDNNIDGDKIRICEAVAV